MSDRKFVGSDTPCNLLHSFKSTYRTCGPFGVIICGKQAVAGDTAQVGPGIAVPLGTPFVAPVAKIEIGMSLVCSFSTRENAGADGRIAVMAAQDIGCDIEKIGLQGFPTSVVQEFSPVRSKKRYLFLKRSRGTDSRNFGCFFD